MFRLLITYLAQVLLGVVMYFIFRYFSRLYIRRFLRTWSQSWIAFAVYMFCTAILTVLPQATDAPWDRLRLLFSYFAQMGCFLQIVFILLGSHQLVYSKPLSRKLLQWTVVITSFIAMVTVLAYSYNPAAVGERYVLRLGTRSLVSGVGFLVASVIVWVHPKFTRGFGQKLLALSFLVYSVDQFSYLSIIFANVTGSGISLPGSFGLANLVVIALMGISMIMWLLEDEREKLHKANKELDSFLYSTSHDLRAPIASILGLTYLGKLDLHEERAREFMGLIEERVKKLDLIIADILTLSRTKKFEVRQEDINFNHLLEETIVDIKFSKGASSIQLAYDPDPSHIFRSDYHQIKVVLSNLLSNAVKYHNLHQENPFIRVTFDKNVEQEKVIITVEDNGQGIPEASLARIFDMFYRASSTTEGTGLGLYIVKEALSKINGSISVTSTFGKGTCFTVILEHA
ncbi:MAG: HAMP domain-containing histidine kinase [Bacteroidia bacterium]|nr:HAMP domain-containing histidine kinase [Bacteroidia bacterium]